jgi:hypothetical protein
MPQPTATPLTAAMTGLSHSSAAIAAGVGSGARAVAAVARFAGHHFLHVFAGAEGGIGAGDHDATNFLVARRGAEGGFDFGIGARVERVAALGPVQRDDGDMAAQFIEQAGEFAGGHRHKSEWRRSSLPCPRASCEKIVTVLLPSHGNISNFNRLEVDQFRALPRAQADWPSLKNFPYMVAERTVPLPSALQFEQRGNLIWLRFCAGPSRSLSGHSTGFSNSRSQSFS